MQIVLALISIVQMLLWVASMIIIVQAIFSWLVAFNVVNTRSDFVRAVWTALERPTSAASISRRSPSCWRSG